LKSGTAGFFCRESLNGQLFSARNLKIPKIFRLKVENSKKPGAKVKKKDCQLHN